ncbi:hypothetical protein CDD80_6068 [Ophiocordyceps camponoti-rufipedis]|uniref:Uncharacterized protein n=1 Tax=Ophiocordyceps camponoti-rufipedis TaxID=2004952 RepID=A0A2C5YRT7_9HYPO|nr:hypothetical protein CDD80_6068 [Ophiocordyceps camponoti-rufipedis]
MNCREAQYTLRPVARPSFKSVQALLRCDANRADRVQDDLTDFLQSHFAAEAVFHFGQTFRNPSVFTQAQASGCQLGETVEDDLGYYDDGVKRTLTDEQIDLFRRSELREMLLKQRKAVSDRSTKSAAAGAAEEGPDAASSSASGVKRKRKKKRKNKNGAPKPRYEPKPDLRKRTWDVVDKGLDSLDYG